jgi:hypothetical protein
LDLANSFLAGRLGFIRPALAIQAMDLRYQSTPITLEQLNRLHSEMDAQKIPKGQQADILRFLGKG